MSLKLIKRLINNRYFQSARNIITDPHGNYARKKFVNYMNSTAKDIHMLNSCFFNASGTSSLSYSTALDLSYLCEKAIHYDYIIDIWQRENFCVDIEGTNNRKINIENIVQKNCIPQLKDLLIGGKSGSWYNKYKAHIFYLKIKGEKYTLSILARDKISFKQIYTLAHEICINNFSGNISNYTKNMLDNNGGFLLKNIDTGNIFCKNENKKLIPASVTKVLTAICALESGLSLDSAVTVSHSDISKGSGSKFFPGDTVTLSQALYIMIMESSNTMANAIARTVGMHI